MEQAWSMWLWLNETSHLNWNNSYQCDPAGHAPPLFQSFWVNAPTVSGSIQNALCIHPEMLKSIALSIQSQVYCHIVEISRTCFPFSVTSLKQ